jgi:hypothetical protein
MATKISLSAKATTQMYEVRTRLRLERRDLLWTLRIALARSIQAKHKVDLQVIPFSPSSDGTSGGKSRFQIETTTLEQKDALLLRSLLTQHYGEKLDDDTYEVYLRRHIEHGLQLIHEETQNYSGYEYLVTMARTGLKATKNVVDTEAQPTKEMGFNDVISLRIGVEKSTNQPHIINFNKTDEHANNYVGIIGKPGSGKTYFVKYLLKELRKQSQFQTNFIIFDYAKGDIADDNNFVRETRAQLIQVDREPIPINIFQTTSPAERNFAAERIVRVVRDVEANIGKVQENNLYNAIINSYTMADADGYSYPDFQMVRQALDQINPRADSLTSVFRPLTEHNLFASRQLPIWNSLIDHTVVFDIHRLPAMKDLCVFLVLNELYRQLMLMPDSSVDPRTSARQMRIVIVLDEAHHFLKVKKRVQVLENMIREIRSKGASVMLLSQSPDDYDQTDFNFLELLEFVYVLGCNVSSHKFLEQSFGIAPERAKRLMQEISQLKQGEAIGKAKANQFTQLLLTR